mgnify:CR=1 FL=1
MAPSLAKFLEDNGYFIGNKWYPRVTKIISIKRGSSVKKNPSAQGPIRPNNMPAWRVGQIVHEFAGSILSGEKKEVPKGMEWAARALDDLFPHIITPLPEWTEKRICNRKEGYAGTVDMVAEINGVLTIIDIKTGRNILDEYRLQTSAYAEALREEGLVVKERAIFHLTPDGGQIYFLGPWDRDFEAFLAAKNLFSWHYRKEISESGFGGDF